MNVLARSRDQIGYRLANAALRIATPQYRATLKGLIVLGMDSADAPQPQGAVEECERLRANLAAIRCEIDARQECADMKTVRFYANEDTDMRNGGQ